MGERYHRQVLSLKVFLVAVLLLCVMTSGCTKVLTRHFAQSVEKMHGETFVHGLNEPVTVSRDRLGIPCIDAATMEDLSIAMGYVHASDRLSQMTGLKLMAQGRLAELAGDSLIDIDVYMRTLNLKKKAADLWEALSPENQFLIARYSDGVNAYQNSHRDRLPPGLRLSGYAPEPWEPIDSLCLFFLVNLALSFNLHQEITILSIAAHIGPEKTAWLLPIYPDEPIPSGEARKLSGLELGSMRGDLSRLWKTQETLEALGMGPVAASNNWALSKDRTDRGASILANDTHLLLSFPSLWNMIHVKCGSYQAAGISLAGIPSVVAGFNGHIAWGMTMVMADNQDLFLEQLKLIDGELHYLNRDAWLPVQERTETFRIRGKKKPLEKTIRETIRGPLLNDVLTARPKHMVQPGPLDLPYGISFSWAVLGNSDETINSFFSLSRARSVEEAFQHVPRIRTIALNMVFADRDSIAWQVTGLFPVRKAGRGLVPSPGWTGDYDWTGFLDSASHPYSLNPPKGYIATANHRTVPSDFPHTLSSSWYWPERHERIEQLIEATEFHTRESVMAMQLDVQSAYTVKLKEVLFESPLASRIDEEIMSWNDHGRQTQALRALEILREFDGVMHTESLGAALMGAFYTSVTRAIFLDELGPETSPAWQSFLVLNNICYSPTSDHLTVRGDESPFWNDISTPEPDTKAQIIARSLAEATRMLEETFGKDSEKWQWGKLHTYSFETDSSKMVHHLGILERFLFSLFSPFFNRGPFPAPGDHTTLNVSAYHMGHDFDTWLIPAMRMIVDFGLDEPLVCINSSGQSDNPASPHYDDGIEAWLAGTYQSFPFQQSNRETHYTRVLTLRPLEIMEQ